MSTFEQIKHIRDVWVVALPHVAAPQIKDIRYWTGIEPSVLDAAILRAGTRFAPDTFTEELEATRVYRWITGTAKRIYREKSEKDDNRGNRL